MQINEDAKSEGTNNVLMWVVSSGLVAALLGVWATLFGLLYRTGWLAAFGVSPDAFLPASATELTLWSYLAMLETWNDARSKIWPVLLWCFGSAAFGLVIGIALALLMKKSGRRIRKLKTDLRVQASVEISTAVVAITLAPVGLILAAALLLCPPAPALMLGKAAAARAIDRHRSNDAGPDRCWQLATASGNIGKCPMVIAQTTDRIAFLDGEMVKVIPSAGVQISWKLHVGPAKMAQ